MRKFLSEYDLYAIYEIEEVYDPEKKDYTSPFDFIGETFDYYCTQENSIKTFELDLDKPNKKYFGEIRGDIIPNDCLVNQKLNYTFKAIGHCKSCNSHIVNFLLHVYSNNSVGTVKNQKKHISITPGTKIFIQKVGCFPEVEIFIDKEISKHFDRETNIWYYKAKNSLKKNFGIIQKHT